MRWQKLGLAEFAGPGADHLRRRKVAAIDDLQRGDGLALEHLRAAAIIGQRHQRAQRRQIAHIGAEIALQPPERGDYRGRHAIVALGARECCRVSLDACLALLHPVIGGHAPRKLGEQLAEYPLAAVAVDDALVINEVGRGDRQRALRHAFGGGIAFQPGQELLKVLAAMAAGAALRLCRGRQHQGRRQRRGDPENSRSTRGSVLGPVLGSVPRHTLAPHAANSAAAIPCCDCCRPAAPGQAGLGGCAAISG